jgi:hypothetical protein
MMMTPWYKFWFSGDTEIEAIDNYRKANPEATASLHDVDVLDVMWKECQKWDAPLMYPRPDGKPISNIEKWRIRRRNKTRLECARMTATWPKRPLPDYTDEEIRAAAEALNPKRNSKPKEEA